MADVLLGIVFGLWFAYICVKVITYGDRWGRK